MLEIPESFTIARQIDETLCGKKIKDVTAAQSPHGFAFYFENPQDYANLLIGKRIESAKAQAGWVQVEAEGAQMLFNDGVNIRYYEPGAKLPPKHQLYIEFDDDSKMICTVQMYGAMLVFPRGMFANEYYTAALEKPSPLSEDFDEVYFERLRKETPGKLSAKAFLATEQRIPGLGNGCLQDILFCAKVHPQSKLLALSDEDMQMLFESVKGVLNDMCKRGGRDTEKDFFAKPGGYKSILSSKTLAYPCPNCGGSIIRKAFLGGNVYFCPNCQVLKK